MIINKKLAGYRTSLPSNKSDQFPQRVAQFQDITDVIDQWMSRPLTADPQLKGLEPARCTVGGDLDRMYPAQEQGAWSVNFSIKEGTAEKYPDLAKLVRTKL